MDADRIDSLLDLADQLQRRALDSEKPSRLAIFEKRTVERSLNLAALAASAFSEGSLERALYWITQAINVAPSAPLYTKRSVIHLLRQHNILGGADATSAIGLDSEYAGGYYCAALARIRLGEYEGALVCLEKLRKCFPNSKKVNSVYVSCRNTFWKTGKIQPFHLPESIDNDIFHEEYSALSGSRIADLKVELSNSGVLEASKLTEDFVRRVIETYKRSVFHLPQKYVMMILKNVLDILREHSNIVSIDIANRQTLIVVGDLRGKFNNLLSILRHNRSPHFGRPYLFNGNIIGYDKMSLPVLVIVLSLKILFPEDVFINRGSEECLEMCEINGFEEEVLTVYDEDTMKAFAEVFNWLPVAHILNNNVLFVHGGLFEDESVTLADIQRMKRCYQPPDSGPMCDILHSDPWNYKGISKQGRRRGILFGPDVTERFCQRNCIDYIVRSHETVGEYGYESQTYKQCFTVNSSTVYATFLIIRGKTSSLKSVHARKDRWLPKDCTCFLVCKCKDPDDEKQREPNDGYVTTNLQLPTVPSIIKISCDEPLASSTPLNQNPNEPDLRPHSTASLCSTNSHSSRKIIQKTSDLGVKVSSNIGKRIRSNETLGIEKSQETVISANHHAPPSLTVSETPSTSRIMSNISGNQQEHDDSLVKTKSAALRQDSEVLVKSYNNSDALSIQGNGQMNVADLQDVMKRLNMEDVEETRTSPNLEEAEIIQEVNIISHKNVAEDEMLQQYLFTEGESEVNETLEDQESLGGLTPDGL